MADGRTVLVFPAYRENPFLNILALAARADGWRFVLAETLDELAAAVGGLGAGDILHLHWTAPLLQNAPDASAAAERLHRFRALLGALRAAGARLVWTVHNRLPHELRHRDLEIELQRELAVAADRIHIMSPSTPELLAEVCDLPADKLVHIPHPSYEGVYDAAGPTAEARATTRAGFGIAPGDRAALFFGHMRSYKGVAEFVDAAVRARRAGSDVAVLLAGSASDEERRAVIEAIPADLPAATHFGYVADADLPDWLSAADVAVLPFRAILNSGSVHLAATFRVPVVLPDEAHLRRQLGDQPWVAFFDTTRPVDSIAELLCDTALFSTVTDADFRRFTDPIAPWTVSRAYASLLADVSGAAISRASAT